MDHILSSLAKPHVDKAAQAVFDKFFPYLVAILIGLFTCISSFIFWLYVEYWSSSYKRKTELQRPYCSPLRAADHASDGKHHLLLCATGSVATIKIPNIVQALSGHDNLSIRIVLTDSALEFLQGQSAEQPSIASLTKMRNVDAIYVDEDEWSKPWIRKDNILHIELRRWADLMVIAPLSANSLAKLALGLSDDLVSSVARAWDTSGFIDLPRPSIRFPYAGGTKKGIMVAPAMNTAMWEHPITARHVSVLENEWGQKNGGWFEMLRPQERDLACGDTGSGAMHNWSEIVRLIEKRLSIKAS